MSGAVSVFAVVPVKDLAGTKSRLEPILNPGARAGLTLYMMGRVVAALRGAGVENVGVVSPDWIVLGEARKRGATPLRQESRGLNPALDEGRRWAMDRGVWVVSDEIYEHLIYGDARFTSMPALVPDLADTCVVINGVAKTYAMTGWRVGWMIGPPDVIATTFRPRPAISRIRATPAFTRVRKLAHDSTSGRSCEPLDRGHR